MRYLVCRKLRWERKPAARQERGEGVRIACASDGKNPSGERMRSDLSVEDTVYNYEEM